MIGGQSACLVLVVLLDLNAQLSRLWWVCMTSNSMLGDRESQMEKKVACRLAVSSLWRRGSFPSLLVGLLFGRRIGAGVGERD